MLFTSMSLPKSKEISTKFRLSNMFLFISTYLGDVTSLVVKREVPSGFDSLTYHTADFS